MAGEIYVPQRLRERGVRISIPIEDPDLWQNRVQSDRALPANYAELSALVGRHFPATDYPAGDLPPNTGSPLVDTTCGTSLYRRIYSGLSNPELAAEERDSIVAALTEATPTDWNVNDDFPHFTLRWTETDPIPANNLNPANAPALIAEAGTLLEQAWQALSSTFGRAPYRPSGANKIQIDFQDLPDDLQGQADPPDGPIMFDAERWQASPPLRAPLAAHELFHKLQHAFGYRVTWPQSNIAWFSEGTARWAEVFVYQRLTAATWLTGWLADPTLDLLAISSFALPFWLFFDARLRSANHNALLDLLNWCEAEQEVRQGLDKTLELSNQTLSEFFMLFAAESFLGESRRMPDGQVLYPQILGLDGQPIESRPKTKTVTLKSGEIFPDAAPELIPLEAFGSCYYAFKFTPGADGRPFRLEVQAAETLTYQVISERAGSKVAQFSKVTDNFVHEAPIQLAMVDTLVLVVSGRGAPVQVGISAQVG